MKSVTFDEESPGVVLKVKIKPGYNVYRGMPVMHFRDASAQNGDASPAACSNGELRKLKVHDVGTVKSVLVKEGDVIEPGAVIFTMEPCRHPTVMKEMCAECGADLQTTGETKTMTAAIPIVHNIPELMVSPEEAQTLGQDEEQRLLRDRKLVLLVDLDQTLIHTTNDIIPPKIKDVYHYKLGANPAWYHTRLRPYAREFLTKVSSLFELHICTFGARLYAHQIAYLLDPEGRFFSTRILSRDECFDPRLKTANLKALFPCGDHMVCIIDDREDVWNWAPNLVRVKPYHFFRHTGDINAPPGLNKSEDDEKFGGVDLESVDNAEKSEKANGKNSVIKRRVEYKEQTPSAKSLPNGDDERRERGSTDSDGASSDDEESSSEDTKKKRPSPSHSPSEDGVRGIVGGAIPSKPEIKEDVDVKNPEESSSNIAEEAVTSASSKDAKTNDREVLDPEDLDDHLLHLEAILRRIHAKFFSAYDAWRARRESAATSASPEKVGPLPDLKTIVPEIRGSVLSGLNIVFSGVVPTRTPLKQSAPYRIATALGANVTENIVDDGPCATTHLVAQRYGTAKVHQVKKKPNVSVVTTDWLWCCAERWERADERLFRLSKEHTQSSSSQPGLGLDFHPTAPPRRSISSSNTEFQSKSDEDTSSDSQGSTVFEETLKNPFMMFSKEELDDMDKEVDEMCSSESSSEDDGEEEKQVVVERPKRRHRLSQSIDVDVEEDSAQNPTTMEEEGSCSDFDGEDERRRKKRRILATATTTDDSDVNASLYPKEGLITGSSSDEESIDDDDDTLDGMAHRLEEQMDSSF